MAIQVNGNTVIDNTQNITNINSYSGDGVATQEEAEDGTNNDQLMTPLRVLESIKKNGGSTIDKISDDLDILGPLPTIGAWEWNDDYTKMSDGLLPSSIKSGAVGNQLHNYEVSSTTSSVSGKVGGVVASAAASGNKPLCIVGNTFTNSFGQSVAPPVNTGFDNFAAFGGTLIGGDMLTGNWDWKVAYNLNMINWPGRASADGQNNLWDINFRNLTELRGGFGITIVSNTYLQNVSQIVGIVQNVTRSNSFTAILSFPELTTIETDRPIIRWERIGQGAGLGLRLEVPKLDSASLSKLILGMDGAVAPSSNISIISPLSLSNLTTEAQNHFIDLIRRYTIDILPS